MYDVYLIANKDVYLQEYKDLKSKIPMLKCVDSIDQAQKSCITKFFWAVYPDLDICEDFNFDYVPDDWSQDYVHVFLNDKEYDGISLIPKKTNVSQKEIDYRFFVNKKFVEIVASKPKSYDYFEIDSYEEYCTAIEKSKTQLFWMSSRNIKVNNFYQDFYISHHDSSLRQQNHAFIHRVDNEDYYNGLLLCSKDMPLTEKEVEHRFPVNRKEWDIVASGPCKYDIFEISTFEQYTNALENTKTEMFWMSSANIDATIPDIYFTHDQKYNRLRNHAFIHRVKGEDHYNGLFLCSKLRPLSKKEVDYRHPVDRKEWDIVGSTETKYQIYFVDSYQAYLDAYDRSDTEMFYVVPGHVDLLDDFAFDDYYNHENEYDRKINHVFLNGEFHDGVVLCSKHSKISAREWQFMFIQHKKEHNKIVSTPKPYDMVFISYQEPNADENYERILQKYPHCKRVHGVKGIHQAHIEAAKICSTPMFWIIDGDAHIEDDFNFEYQVPVWQWDHVHVWRSRNPVNGLVYGYGGVKLFPRELTINMDTSKPDMTTSISSKFKAVQKVSNVTAFNVGEFETWKSAFRECCKLSSKVIDRQKDVETDRRLKIWSSIGRDKPFGEFAIRGAKEGTMYGTANKGNIEALKKINDFDWLKEVYNGNL
jgi:hypothetical protein